MNKGLVAAIVIGLVAISISSVSLYTTLQFNSQLNAQANELNDLSALTGLKVIEGARAEGTVVVAYVAPAVLMNSIVQAFESTYPFIHVQTVRYDGGTLTTRYESEVSANKVSEDILETSDDASLISWGQQKLLTNYNSSQYASFSNQTALSGYWGAIRTLPGVMVYNTNCANASSLNSFSDINKPQFTGKIVIDDIRTATNGLIWYYQTTQALGGQWSNGFFAQKPVFVSSPTVAVQDIALGQYCLDPYVPIATAINVKNSQPGAPLAFKFPTDGVPFVFGAVAIAKGAPNPNAAKLFLDFCLSAEVANLVSKNNYYPMRVGASEPSGLPPISSLKFYPTLNYTQFGQVRNALVNDISGNLSSS